jgi:hypothetical protein
MTEPLETLAKQAAERLAQELDVPPELLTLPTSNHYAEWEAVLNAGERPTKVERDGDEGVPR